jgi:hypothetical protein
MYDIVDMLEAYRHADQVLGHPRCALLLICELLVGGGCRMDHQRLGITDIGQVAGQHGAVNELASGFVSALDAEIHHGAEFPGVEVFLSEIVVFMPGQAGKVHPFHVLVAFQPLGQRQRVVAMTFGT